MSQPAASRPPQVEGLWVDVDYLSALMGSRVGKASALEACCSEEGTSSLSTWFHAVGDRMKETHLLPMMRRCCPEEGDGRFLDMFDLLDVEARGRLQFPELHLLACILTGRGEGKMRQFLYLRGKDSFAFLVTDAGAGQQGGGGGSLSKTGSSSSDAQPRKVKARRLFRFLTVFGFDQYVTATLNDLQLSNKQQLTENEVSLLLFSICQQHDADHAALLNKGVGAPGGGALLDTAQEAVESDEVNVSTSGSSMKSKLCSIS